MRESGLLRAMAIPTTTAILTATLSIVRMAGLSMLLPEYFLFDRTHWAPPDQEPSGRPVCFMHAIEAGSVDWLAAVGAKQSRRARITEEEP